MDHRRIERERTGSRNKKVSIKSSYAKKQENTCNGGKALLLPALLIVKKS